MHFFYNLQKKFPKLALKKNLVSKGGPDPKKTEDHPSSTLLPEKNSGLRVTESRAGVGFEFDLFPYYSSTMKKLLVSELLLFNLKKLLVSELQKGALRVSHYSPGKKLLASELLLIAELERLTWQPAQIGRAHV